jgi:putative DNA primase/helicase
VADTETTSGADRPQILLVTADPHISADEGIEAVKAMPGAPIIFQRGGGLVHIAAQAPATARQKVAGVTDRIIAPITLPLLRELLSQAAIWRTLRRRKDGTDDWVAVPPPRHVAEAILARDQWTFPVLTGVISAPTLRPDLSVLDQPGYDPQTGLYADF